MKTSWTLFSGFVLSAWASAIPESMKLYLSNRAVTVTQSDVSRFDFYAQYAAAGYCNSDADVGTAVQCAEDACLEVEAAGAVVTATFAGVVTDIQGFVSTDDTNQLIVASFRGSHSVRNWISDLVFFQTPCDITLGCLVHTGFSTAWAEVADDVSAAIEAAAAAYPGYSIIFTGHSLGAAVATLGAAYVRKQGFAIDIYTYASPRVGNREFVAFVTDQAGAEYRFTHVDDPVPRLPPVLLNYRHTSPEYWLSTGAANTTRYSASEIKVCEGYANLACNGRTLGLDTEAHGYYFVEIDGCSPDDTPFRKRDDGNLTDPELLATLNTYVAQDIAYVDANLGGDVWA